MCTDRMNKTGDLGLDEIAQRMIEDEEKCYSGADVADICDKAGHIRAIEAREKNERSSDAGLRKIDLEDALTKAKPSLSKEAVEALRGWSIAGVEKVG